VIETSGKAGAASSGAVLRATWFVVLPLLLTALVFRYLLLSPARIPDGPLRELSEVAETHQAAVLALSFVLFAGLLRYWRNYLPAAKLWVEAPAAKERRTGPLAALSMTTVLLTGAVLAALVLRGSFFQTYRVLSGSMLPTLEPADLVLSTQYAYGFRAPWSEPKSPAAPRRGDIVVFHRTPQGPDIPEELVKRVIGLPGDTILTNGGFVSINGWRVPTCNVAPYVFIEGEGMLEAHLRMEFLEDRVYLTAHGPAQPEEREPYVVQPGEVFVLGDNRNNSSDSRAWNNGKGGGLRLEEIRGRVDRLMMERRRDGSWDFSRFLKPLGYETRTENIEDTDIRNGIEYCFAHRPKDTRPPPPSAPTATESTP
jgi:signal peptidase I